MKVTVERKLKHEHRFALVATYHYTPGLFVPPQSTVVLKRCPCGELTTQTLPGSWTLAQLRGRRS